MADCTSDHRSRPVKPPDFLTFSPSHPATVGREAGMAWRHSNPSRSRESSAGVSTTVPPGVRVVGQTKRP